MVREVTNETGGIVEAYQVEETNGEWGGQTYRRIMIDDKPRALPCGMKAQVGDWIVVVPRPPEPEQPAARPGDLATEPFSVTAEDAACIEQHMANGTAKVQVPVAETDEQRVKRVWPTAVHMFEDGLFWIESGLTPGSAVLSGKYDRLEEAWQEGARIIDRVEAKRKDVADKTVDRLSRFPFGEPSSTGSDKVGHVEFWGHGSFMDPKCGIGSSFIVLHW